MDNIIKMCPVHNNYQANIICLEKDCTKNRICCANCLDKY